jgi:hypothetical protein
MKTTMRERMAGALMRAFFSRPLDLQIINVCVDDQLDLVDAVLAEQHQTAWLIEWPEDDNLPVRWWNPNRGWMCDADKALWFVRETDASDYIAAGHWAAGIKPTEHIFICRSVTLPQADHK